MMRARPFVGAALTVVLTAIPLAGSAPAPASSGGSRPGEALPVVLARHYRMSGHIRPLLFWISRDDVGDGSLVWRRGPDGAVGWDFLVGTDPTRAPRGLNRWGFIAEEARGRSGALLAMMSQSTENTLDEARSGDDRRKAGGAFEAIRATVDAGECRAQISRVGTPTTLTIRDVDTLVELVRGTLEQVSLQVTPIGPDVRPGFLGAVAELVDASVAAQQGAGAARTPGAAVPYVFGRKLYDVRLTSERRLAEFRDGDRRYRNVVQAKFEILTHATGDRTHFELVYGMDGDLAGVPVQIVYLPRWWLKVVLHLD